MTYTPTVWVNDVDPPISADNLNHIESGISTLDTKLLGVGKVTTSTLAGGPPGSPGDTDVWIATAVDAVGTRWMFQYNAGSSSAYKWEFIGGSPADVEVQTGENTSSGSYADLATVGPSFTVPRNGDYIVQFGSNVTNISGSTVAASIALYSSTIPGIIANSSANASPGTNAYESVNRQIRLPGLVAASTLKMQYVVAFGGGTVQHGQRVMTVIPIRVS